MLTFYLNIVVSILFDIFRITVRTANFPDHNDMDLAFDLLANLTKNLKFRPLLDEYFKVLTATKAHKDRDFLKELLSISLFTLLFP